MNLLAIETATECCSAALLAGDAPDRAQRARAASARRAVAADVRGGARRGRPRTARSRRRLRSVADPARSPACASQCLPRRASRLRSALPVVPVSSLAALAMQAPDDGATCSLVIDARMGEVYAAFSGAVGDRVEAISDETVGSAGALQRCRRSAERDRHRLVELSRRNRSGDRCVTALGRRRALSAGGRCRATRGAGRGCRRRRCGGSACCRCICATRSR